MSRATPRRALQAARAGAVLRCSAGLEAGPTAAAVAREKLPLVRSRSRDPRLGVPARMAACRGPDEGPLRVMCQAVLHACAQLWEPSKGASLLRTERHSLRVLNVTCARLYHVPSQRCLALVRGWACSETPAGGCWLGCLLQTCQAVCVAYLRKGAGAQREARLRRGPQPPTLPLVVHLCLCQRAHARAAHMAQLLQHE